DAEILECGAKENRSQMALTESLELKRPAGFFHQIELVGDRPGVEHRIFRGKRGKIQRLTFNRRRVFADKPHFACCEIIGSGEVAAAPNRPCHWRGIEGE